MKDILFEWRKEQSDSNGHDSKVSGLSLKQVSLCQAHPSPSIAPCGTKPILYQFVWQPVHPQSSRMQAVHKGCAFVSFYNAPPPQKKREKGQVAKQQGQLYCADILHGAAWISE